MAGPSATPAGCLNLNALSDPHHDVGSVSASCIRVEICDQLDFPASVEDSVRLAPAFRFPDVGWLKLASHPHMHEGYLTCLPPTCPRQPKPFLHVILISLYRRLQKGGSAARIPVQARWMKLASFSAGHEKLNLRAVWSCKGDIMRGTPCIVARLVAMPMKVLHGGFGGLLGAWLFGSDLGCTAQEVCDEGLLDMLAARFYRLTACSHGPCMFRDPNTRKRR